MKSRIPQGMGGNPQNMQGMLKQAQKIQDDMARVQLELEVKEYEVTVGGGAVKTVISGKKEVLSLEIKPEVVDPEDIEMLQDLIISAINEGIRKVETESEEEMEKITGGMKMPF